VPEQSEFTTAITHINLSGIKMASAQLQSLADCVQANESLQELILEDCGIDFGREDLSSQMEALCKHIGSHKSIRKLSLAHNTLNDGAQNCLPLVLSSPSLSELDLSFTRIGDPTVRKLAAALPQSPALTRLNLHGNNCDQDGALALQVAIQKYPKLQFLDVVLNKIKF